LVGNASLEQTKIKSKKEKKTEKETDLGVPCVVVSPRDKSVPIVSVHLHCDVLHRSAKHDRISFYTFVKKKRKTNKSFLFLTRQQIPATACKSASKGQQEWWQSETERKILQTINFFF
jgi:hypothetical protein